VVKRARWHTPTGLTLVETTIMLTVAAILTAALAPVGKRTIDISRLARAKADLSAINESILAFVDSTGLRQFSADGAPNGQRALLLVSDGDIPTEQTGAGDPSWLEPVDGTDVDFLERHLITNDPGGSDANAYRVPSTVTGKGWRGAYLTGPVTSDPWGNRYMVNVGFMVAPTRWGPFNDVWVYSAGPDEIVDTEFAVDGAVPRNDDLMLIVFRHPLAASDGKKTKCFPGSDRGNGNSNGNHNCHSGPKPGDWDDDDDRGQGHDKDQE
jgi:type II secretory pathway pseudopilin PulG